VKTPALVLPALPLGATVSVAREPEETAQFDFRLSASGPNPYTNLINAGYPELFRGLQADGIHILLRAPAGGGSKQYDCILSPKDAADRFRPSSQCRDFN